MRLPPEFEHNQIAFAEIIEGKRVLVYYVRGLDRRKMKSLKQMVKVNIGRIVDHTIYPQEGPVDPSARSFEPQRWEDEGYCSGPRFYSLQKAADWLIVE